MTDTRYTKQQAGAVLAYAWIAWTENEDALGGVHLEGFALRPMEKCVLSIRNGSPTVDVTSYYGNWRPETGSNPAVVCTMNDTANTVTSTAHGLYVGQKIYFGTTMGGVVVESDGFYYVVAVTDADTFQFSTARGGAAFEITVDGANTYHLGGQGYVMGSVTVEKYAGGTSTTPTLGQEEVLLEGVASPFYIQVAKSAVTAAAFNVYVELRKA